MLNLGLKREPIVLDYLVERCLFGLVTSVGVFFGSEICVSHRLRLSKRPANIASVLDRSRDRVLVGSPVINRNLVPLRPSGRDPIKWPVRTLAADDNQRSVFDREPRQKKSRIFRIPKQNKHISSANFRRDFLNFENRCFSSTSSWPQDFYICTDLLIFASPIFRSVYS
jgi:hypothetical protein